MDEPTHKIPGRASDVGLLPTAWRLVLGAVFVLSGLAERLLHWVRRPDSAVPPREFTVAAVYLGLIFAGYALLVWPVDAWANRRRPGWLGAWVEARVRQGVGFFVGGSLVVIARVLFGPAGWWVLAGVWLILFLATAWMEKRLVVGGQALPWRRTFIGWAWLTVGLWASWWWMGHHGVAAEVQVAWLAVGMGLWMELGRRWRGPGWMWTPSVAGGGGGWKPEDAK